MGAIDQVHITDPLLLPPEAAPIVRLAVSTLAKKRRNGQGPRYVMLSNRRVGYRLSALQAWLAERERSSTVDPPNTNQPPEAPSPVA